MPIARSHTHSLVTSDKHLYLHFLMQATYYPAITPDYLTPFLSVQVWFREGIYHHNPEGSLWDEVPLPGEVVQISCGPGDLVWAVLWEGQFIVREGISRDCPKGTQVHWWEEDVVVIVFIVCIENKIFCMSGTSWVVVDSPSPDVGAIHVAVGINVVWALTKDNKVRKFRNEHNKKHNT